MSENTISSYLSNIDWREIWQWYSTHISSEHLIRNWKHGDAFSANDWLTITLLTAHLLIVFVLIYQLIKRYRQAKFHTWIDGKRAQLTHRPAKKREVMLEAKITDSACLKQAYNFHRYGMYDQALEKYKRAFHDTPEDINTYLVGIKIISEMEIPDSNFIHFFQKRYSGLREKRSSIWKEVARYGSKKAPDLCQWKIAAI